MATSSELRKFPKHICNILKFEKTSNRCFLTLYRFLLMGLRVLLNSVSGSEIAVCLCLIIFPISALGKQKIWLNPFRMSSYDVIFGEFFEGILHVSGVPIDPRRRTRSDEMDPDAQGCMKQDVETSNAYENLKMRVGWAGVQNNY